MNPFKFGMNVLDDKKKKNFTFIQKKRRKKIKEFKSTV